jgi:hypothetical protein
MMTNLLVICMKYYTCSTDLLCAEARNNVFDECIHLQHILFSKLQDKTLIRNN